MADPVQAGKGVHRHPRAPPSGRDCEGQGGALQTVCPSHALRLQLRDTGQALETGGSWGWRGCRVGCGAEGIVSH